MPTARQYVVNTSPSTATNVVPVKAKPTAEKASTRRISPENATEGSSNRKNSKGSSSPQIKGIISDADDKAEYNAVEQSYAGYNAKENEEKFYDNSANYKDDKSALLERNDSSPFTPQFERRENTTLQQRKEEDNKQLSENETPKKVVKQESQQKGKHSSDENDYKDEIEKEAVEQEKEADEKAEKKGPTDEDDDDDDDENDDADDDDDDDEQNDGEDGEDDVRHFSKDSTKQDDGINNPANRSFAVSPTVVPGMCPPCRKYC